MKKQQKGFTLLEIMMVAVISVVIAMIGFQESTLRSDQEKARALGGELLKFNNGVRDYVSHYAGEATYASHLGTKVGVDWLKSTSCGGTIPKDVANDGFVPCTFLQDTNQLTTYGRLSFTTEITSSAPNIMNTRTTMSELKIAKKQRGDLAGLAAIVAGSASQLNFTPTIRTTDGTARFCITESVTQCQGHLGRILMFTSNDASDDTWLRTDGSNTMNNNLKFKSGNPDANREIWNVSKLFNIEGPYLTLGNKTGALPTFLNDGVVVDSDAEIMGTLYADRMVDRNNANFYVDPGSQSRFNIVNAENINVTNNVVVGGSVTASRFVDRDNAAYFADPNGDSKLHTITSAAITGEGGALSLNGQVNVNGVANMYSNLNVAGSTNMYGGAYLGNVVGEGTFCPTIGALARDGNGKTLSCQANVWRSSGSISPSTPVTLVHFGDNLSHSYCQTMTRTSLITATGAGNTFLYVDGIEVGSAQGWSGRYIDCAIDTTITTIVQAGHGFCFSSNVGNADLSQSRGLKVVATYLD
jgi:prepilin-type N-terminal cleavage/methylation domain-containing protein